MTITVLENAYLRKAEEHPSFCEIHKKIMLLLMNEKKYFTKDELICFSNYNEKKLNKILKDLEAKGVITVDGWLVKLADYEKMSEIICKKL
ncbi:MAG: hypothetical protein NTZ73_03565 [Candidatus Diapherotrites archaeon]|nr:hypothetical protein [Candidatus Diapherotrites archaeon]